MSSLQVLQDLPQVGRKMRRPAHPSYIEHLPYVIQPFMLAPVLPGETLKKLMFQSRAITSPIKNPLIGWHLEHYWFYVPFSAMPHFADMKALITDNTNPGTAIGTGASVSMFHKNGPNFVKECLQAVVEAHFRDEGDGYLGTGMFVSDQNAENMPLCRVTANSWMDSVWPKTAIGTSGTADDQVVGIYGDIDTQRLTYERLRDLGMVDMTYEDYLVSEGIKVPGEASVPKPELLRYLRSWQLPSSTINPTDGTPTSAVSWLVEDQANKSRFFKEPGFIIGLTCARPKVYFNRQYGNASALLQTALSWLPSVMHEAAASIIEVTKTTGPLGSGTADGTSPADNYIVDVRDLLLYGDQFVNKAMTGITDTTGTNLVPLPTTGSTSAIQKQYLVRADINAFFVGSTDATRLVKQDAITSLHILGRQTDQTRHMAAI